MFFLKMENVYYRNIYCMFNVRERETHSRVSELIIYVQIIHSQY